MAESLFILEIEFLHIGVGCSLFVVFFVLMLVGTCCLILSTSLCVVHPTYSPVRNRRGGVAISGGGGGVGKSLKVNKRGGCNKRGVE